MKILLFLNDIFSAGIRKPGSVLAVVLATGLLLGATAAQAADPVANAGGPYDGEVGIPVEFNGLGSTDEDNDIVSYAWQFGDNTFGTGPTPTHTYSTQGTFNVFLSVTDAEGGTGGAPTQVMIVAAGSSNKPPEADPGDPYLGTVDSPVYFDGSGSTDEDGTIEEYSWSFGDPNDRAPSFEKSPSHIYTEPGTYIVNLTVTDNDGISSTNVGNTTTATITDAEGNPPPESIGNEPPTADAGDSVTGTAGVAVNFDGSGSSDPDGDPLSYAWDFGDNSQLGGGAVQSHTYADDGVYNVTLTVTDPDKATSSDTIQAVIGQGAQAPFAQANGPYEGEALLPVTFSASGSKDADGTIESYKWDFGDGSPDGSGSEVSHVYTTSDNYTVTLTVRDNDGLTGTDTASAVIAAGGNHPPEANAGGPYTGPVNAVIQFDGSKSSDDDGDVRSWEWDFGDDTPLAAGPKVRHTYSTAGTYTVTLTVTDDDSARDSQQTVAEVTDGGNQPPDAKAGGPYPGTAGDTVTFDGTGSSDQEGPIAAYSWDFGDGNTGSDAVSSHTYAADGNYTVTLTVTDGDSASDADTTVANIGAVANEPPVAEAGGPYFGPVNVAIDFDGSESSDDDGTIATYAWDFGDGNNGTGITASHTYATTGTFPVTLTVTDDDSDTDTQQTTAYVASGDVAPEAEAGGPYTGAANAAVDFDGSGSSDDSMIETYAWEFGDDNSGAGVMPSNTYAAAGIYISSLTVTDDDNLIDSDGTLALIGLAPQPPQAESNGPFVGAVGAIVKFDAGESSDLDGDIVSYAWDFGDGNNGTGESTQHAYAAPGIYPVTLTVTDNDDNSDEENTAAFIGSGNLPPTADAGAPVAGTAGVAVDFDGSASDDPDGIITTYAWDFGDNTTGSGRSPAHVYSHAGIYNVTLTVTDNDGSSDSDGSFAVVGFSSAPDVGCRDSGKQSLSLKTKNGKFDWKWKKGAATTKADFGDPLTATNYQVCLFDSVDDSLEPDFCVLVPAGADWKEQKKGFKFKSKTGVEGITKIQLKEGKSGKAKITVKGKDMVLPALPLSQDPEVVVQIRNSAGVCWESRVSTAKKNDEKKFKAK